MSRAALEQDNHYQFAYDNGFKEGRKAGLEEAAKVADKVFYEETSGDYWAGQIAERIRRLTQGTDRG
jgi:flagellar biosynthesis/type III secretory pathway protein FliH